MARPLHRTPQLPAATPQCVAEIALLRLILLEKQAAVAHDRNGSIARFDHAPATSGLPPSTDILRVRRHVSKVCHERKSWFIVDIETPVRRYYETYRNAG
jgi:hypothetical protein